MRENFVNFATSNISAAITSTTALSFGVTTSQGAFFPNSNFLVTIDTEVMQIASRTGDTFTVGTRGFDGTIAATHNNGAIVQLSICSYNLVHLWQNIGDTYTPQVPPVQLGVSPQTYDNEFESAGSWTYAPAPSGGTTFSAGSPVRSHLLLNRGVNDNGLYTAYVGFALTTAYTITCKLSQGLSVQRTSTDQSQFSLFVSDSINPSASPDTGNRFRVDTVISTSSTSSILNYGDSVVRGAQNVSGSFRQVGPNQVPISPGVPLYLRITYDGASNYTAFVGDGITYWNLGTASQGAPIQTLGVNFHIFGGGQWVPQVAAVDYVRVTTNTLPPYGSPGY